ncbi:D-alanyl-D-alanine carboxypeptidase/D-alanyl-D-alanine endopeptidase [Leptolyngbya sp. AN02str]|uniref:D-alanyl-D-alanine carboxypeptidase/D-alanyl-D-alanine endopeptidase n=1 Tax=Leptolyngbya sp. AN02str TaxID=3423363 RepID=UPI003D32180D
MPQTHRFALLFASLSVLLGGMAAQASEVCPANLEQAIARTIEQSSVRDRTRWGILVETLDGSQRLYARDAEQFFIPASNVKLFTTAAALAQFGPTYQIRTSVHRTTRQDATELQVVGRGDPNLGTAQLQTLATQLQNQGITAIDRLVAHDHHFRGDPINPNWEWEDLQAGYAPPVNSLIVNENAIALRLIPQQLGQPLRVEWTNPAHAAGWTIDNTSQTVAASEPEFTRLGRDPGTRTLRVYGQLRVGAAPEEDAISTPTPTQHFLQTFRQVLSAAGISVRQLAPGPRVALPNEPLTDPEVAAVLSPPMAELITEANSNSNNLYAEALLRSLGAATSPTTENTLQAGLEETETILASLGVDATGLILADGSGLARKNLATPIALVETLKAMAQHPHAEVFRRSLSVAGQAGTLRSRFRDTVVEGRLYGKTGAISGITALSGYLNPPNYPPLAFSILVNHFDQPVRSVRPTVDEIVLTLANLKPCASVQR